jgi:CheY-like chemotaxis protein
MEPAHSRPLQGLTILVIDDHRDTVDIFSTYFAAYGATVLGAGTAKAALAIAETHVFDVALVDLRMPGEDGWWFLRQLRASPTASANAAVFAVSGERHDRPDPADGFAAYFVKPIDADVLVAMLATLRRRTP